MIALRSFHVVANFTFIRFNLVSTNLQYVNYANNLYRFFSTMVLNLACFSFNMFTYSNMNGTCLKGVYVKPYERNQPKLIESINVVHIQQQSKQLLVQEAR